jgi:hypothetical protein
VRKCNFIQLPESDRWWCQTPRCDPDKTRLCRHKARRRCRADTDDPDVRDLDRRALEADIADDISSQTKTVNEIRAMLDTCFGGCRHMKGRCTRWGTPCEQPQRWIEHLLDGDCDQFTKR